MSKSFAKHELVEQEDLEVICLKCGTRVRSLGFNLIPSTIRDKPHEAHIYVLQWRLQELLGLIHSACFSRVSVIAFLTTSSVNFVRQPDHSVSWRFLFNLKAVDHLQSTGRSAFQL